MGVSAPPRVAMLALLSAALSGCAASSGPGAAARPPTVIVANWSDVEYDRVGGFFIAEAEVPGAGPLRLLVDTGAESTFLDTAAAARLTGVRIRPTADQVRSAHGGTIPIEGIATLDELRVGAVTARGLRAPVISLREVTASLGAPIDGILGWDVLRQVVFIVDYDAGTISLIAPAESSASLTVGGTALEPGDVAIARLELNDRSTRAVIDTGSDGSIAVARLDRLALKEPIRDGGRVRGVGGSEAVRVARLDGVARFGGGELIDPLIETTGGLPRIGASAMAGGRLVLDGPRGRVRFTPPERLR